MTLSYPQLLIDLHTAYLDARRHKRNRQYQIDFEKDMDKNLHILADELFSRTYRPAPSICFIIEDPKKREVFAADFRDRIVHHLYYNYTHELFERNFIADSYSCIKHRGTHNVLQLNKREQLSTEELREGDTRKFKYVPKTAADIFPRYYLIRINSFREVIADAMDEWMDFLKNNSIKPDTTVPGLVEAKEQLQYAKMTPEERYSYERHLDAIENETDAISTAKTEGIAEGIAEGREEGAKQQAVATARKMKLRGYSIDVIADITNLTPEEIAKI